MAALLVCYEHAHSASAFRYIRCRIQSAIVVFIMTLLAAAAAADGTDRQGAGDESARN